MSEPLEDLPAGRGPEWLPGHVLDPEMIASGLREPPVVLHERDVAAIAAYTRRVSRQPYPGFSAPIETVASVWARYCVGCHKIDGDGGTDGPDLTHEGTKHDAATLRRWIVDPELVDPNAEMPSFGDRLSPAQLDAMSAYLAARK
jgi:mono/diheme cytochrome c family protein